MQKFSERNSPLMKANYGGSFFNLKAIGIVFLSFIFVTSEFICLVFFFVFKLHLESTFWESKSLIFNRNIMWSPFLIDVKFIYFNCLNFTVLKKGN